MESAEWTRVLARLESILREVWDEHPEDVPLDTESPLVGLGVDSLTLMLLLDRVEGEFRVEWDADNPPGAFSSLESIADRVAARRPDRTTRR